MNAPLPVGKIVLHEDPTCTVVLLESYCPHCEPLTLAQSISWDAKAHLELGKQAVPFPRFTQQDPIQRAREDVRAGEACSSYAVTASCEQSHAWPTLVRASFHPARKEATS